MGEEAPRSAGFNYHPFNPQDDFLDHTAANKVRPLTSAVITVRLIKNFEYRAVKSVVLKDFDLTTVTAAGLIERCKQEVRTVPGYKVYRPILDKFGASLLTDTLKLYAQAHGAKTTHLVINLDHPEWILDNDSPKTLSELGVGALWLTENETELSLFNRAEYDAFLEKPTTRWDETG